jgi:hypothetical protein
MIFLPSLNLAWFLWFLDQRADGSSRSCSHLGIPGRFDHKRSFIAEDQRLSDNPTQSSRHFSWPNPRNDGPRSSVWLPKRKSQDIGPDVASMRKRKSVCQIIICITFTPFLEWCFVLLTINIPWITEIARFHSKWTVDISWWTTFSMGKIVESR